MGFAICTATKWTLLGMLLISIGCVAGCAGENPVQFVPEVRSSEARPTAQFDQQRELRVMSFNLRTPTIIDGFNHWSFRKDVIVETIREFDPDVLGTQECVVSQAQYLRDEFPEYDFVGAGRNDGKQRGEMCGVFFKRVATGPGWFFEFASYLIPLALLELYLRAKDSRSANAKLATALLFLAVVVYVSFGTVRFAMWVGRSL